MTQMRKRPCRFFEKVEWFGTEITSPTNLKQPLQHNFGGYGDSFNKRPT